jgi:hypothetical protein
VKHLFTRLWERHKNQLSWWVRPLFGALWFYGAWRNSGWLLAAGVLGASTSWFWFPKPARPHPRIERFIDLEKEHLTPPWTAGKVLGLLAVGVFLVIATAAFWRRDAVLGLSLVAFGALLKAAWSVTVARAAGVLPAVIGVLTAAVAGGILYWLLSA